MLKISNVTLSSVVVLLAILAQACGGDESDSSGSDRTIVSNSSPASADSSLKITLGKIQYRPLGPDDPQWQTVWVDSEFTAGLDATGNVLATIHCDLQNPLPESVRSWIGHSNGAHTNPGYSKTQIFEMPPLRIEAEYELRIFPLGSVGIVPYLAKIQSGKVQFLEGQTYISTDKLESFYYSPETQVWKIRFKALSNSASIEIGNFLTSGLNYMYLDYIEFEEI